MFRSISGLFLSRLYWSDTFKCTSGGCTDLPAGFNRSSPLALENLPVQLATFSWKISVFIKLQKLKITLYFQLRQCEVLSR